MISVKEAVKAATVTWTERDQLAFDNAERRIDEAIMTESARWDHLPESIAVVLSGIASLTKKVRIRVEEAYKLGGWGVAWARMGEEEGGPVIELTPPRG